MTSVQRHKAAITRTELSRPVRLAMEDGLLAADAAFFDYGCGRGDDVRSLTRLGFSASGWDPHLRPLGRLEESDVVNLGYVVNVIEDADERAEVVRTAWTLTRRLLVVSARLHGESKEPRGERFADGVLTRIGTFQKFFDQSELRSWIEQALGVPALAAAPGVFYVFRDPSARESFAASRVRRRATTARLTPDALFGAHHEVLRPLIAFIEQRGRLPDRSELSNLAEVEAALGSFRRAQLVVRSALGPEAWTEMELARSEDLLVYLALAEFRGRAPFGMLPADLRFDVRSFFQSYQRACLLADEVLVAAGDRALVERACRASNVGKLTPSALYLHVSALPAAPPLLRVYEGCARSYVGSVEGANIVKLHRGEPRVSYLTYPTFEADAHPALAASLLVPLQTFRIEAQDYRVRANPPILHRKEEFVAADHPLKARFARLTAQEVAAGLYSEPSTIGTADGWAAALARAGRRVVGHRLLRSP